VQKGLRDAPADAPATTGHDDAAVFEIE